MTRIKRVIGFFDRGPNGGSDGTEDKGYDPVQRLIDTFKDGVGRSEVLVQFTEKAGDYVKPLLMAVGIIVGICLLLVGVLSLPLAIAIAAVALILARRYGLAALLLFVLGALGVLGYVSQVSTGGLSEDLDNGFFVGSLGFSAVAACVAYLVREDRMALLLAAVIGFLELIALLVLNLASFSDWFYLLVFAILFMIAFMAVLMVSERLDSAWVSSIGLAVFNGSWLLLSSDAGANFKTLGDGNFEQFLFGGLLMALSAVLLFLQPDPAVAASDVSEGDEDGAGEAPTEEAKPDEFFVRIAAEQAWEGLNPHAKIYFDEVYTLVSKRPVLKVDKSDYLKKALDRLEFSSRHLHQNGLTAQAFRVLAADRFEQAAVINNLVDEHGRLYQNWQKGLIVANDRFLEELGITPDTLLEARLKMFKHGKI